VRVCALVVDLMDRSRITASLPEAVFVRDAAACADADVVIVDLARSGQHVSAVRNAAPAARIVCFGPHVDDEGASAALAYGADAVLPRSRFFRDPSAALLDA
jgi:DNA-binding NarL/FixJ family response regulator